MFSLLSALDSSVGLVAIVGGSEVECSVTVCVFGCVTGLLRAGLCLAAGLRMTVGLFTISGLCLASGLDLAIGLLADMGLFFVSGLCAAIGLPPDKRSLRCRRRAFATAASRLLVRGVDAFMVEFCSNDRLHSFHAFRIAVSCPASSHVDLRVSVLCGWSKVEFGITYQICWHVN